MDRSLVYEALLDTARVVRSVYSAGARGQWEEGTYLDSQTIDICRGQIRSLKRAAY